MKILVVEDDRWVAGFIAMGLRQEGYAVDIAVDGGQAMLLAAVNDYDAILLDLLLPKKNGLQVIVDLRADGEKIPILMLTAKDTAEDLIRGLDAGADDYLPKPFQVDELLARLRVLLRRGGAARLDHLTFGSLVLDRLRHRATASGNPLNLTPRELQLLEHLMLHPEEVIRRTELLEKVWDRRYDPESNVVDVHVGNLRKKLRQSNADCEIRNVRGVGFCLKAENEA